MIGELARLHVQAKQAEARARAELAEARQLEAEGRMAHTWVCCVAWEAELCIDLSEKLEAAMYAARALNN